MATVPIVTEVTKAELDALVAANGLNEGLQYKVTDKDWLLVATGVDTLKSATGTLTIINGTELSDKIETDLLYIDTGVVIGEYENGKIVVHVNYEKYVAFYAEIHIIATNDGEVNYIYDGTPIGTQDMLPGDRAFNLITFGNNVNTVKHIECNTWVDNVDSFRAIIGYYKSKLYSTT